MSDYNVKSVDLTVATPPNPGNLVSTPNKPVDGVTVLSLPAGANVSLAFGQSADPVPLLNQGMSFELCPPEDKGIFVVNPVAGAGQLVLLLSYAPGAVRAAT